METLATMLVILYSSQCKPVQTVQANMVILAPQGQAMIEVFHGRPTQFDLSESNVVEIKAGKIDKFFKNQDGNWVETPSLGCGQI
jgi:hypothetical protein